VSEADLAPRSAVAPRAPAARALALGLASAVFFAVTFVLNRSMANANGHWAWTASLRYLISVPLLAVVLTARRGWGELGAALRRTPVSWILWGTVAFTVFYSPLALAGALAPAWVVAGTWPVTIVAGVLVAPLIYADYRRIIPRAALASSVVIVAGVVLLQAQQARAVDPRTALTGFALVLVAAVAYPLGNRRMMVALENAGEGVDPFVRVAGMTLGSLPAWMAIAAYGHARAGWPPPSQIAQAGIVALSSGLVATALFFAATDRVRRDPAALAAVEATQAAEVPFALVLEVALLGAAWPTPLGLAGLAVIVGGIVLHAWLTSR
jgi:drug/metabolite transporter (DMT)-like permease